MTYHTVVNKNGNDVEIENDNNGQRLCRNIVHLKRIEERFVGTKMIPFVLMTT